MHTASEGKTGAHLRPSHSIPGRLRLLEHLPDTSQFLPPCPSLPLALFPFPSALPKQTEPSTMWQFLKYLEMVTSALSLLLSRYMAPQRQCHRMRLCLLWRTVPMQHSSLCSGNSLSFYLAEQLPTHYQGGAWDRTYPVSEMSLGRDKCHLYNPEKHAPGYINSFFFF